MTEPLGALICVTKSAVRFAASATLTVLIASTALPLSLSVILPLTTVRVANFSVGLSASLQMIALSVTLVKSSVSPSGTIILLHVTELRSEILIVLPVSFSLKVSPNIKPTSL